MNEPASPAAPPSEAPRPRVTVGGVLRLWFTLAEPVGQRAYVTSGLVLAALKYAVDASVVALVSHRFFSPLDYVTPLMALRAKAIHSGVAGATDSAVLIFMALFTLPFLWIGLSMSIRRALDSGQSPWMALWFLVPVINWVIIVWLAVSPARAGSRWPLAEPAVVVDRRLRSGMLGVAAGLGIAGAMVALSIGVLREYGGALFLGTPLFMGAMAAFIHNKGHPRGTSETLFVAVLTVVLSGLGMLTFALEGIVCLLMALPLAALLAVLGALIGRAIALGGSTPSSHAVVALFCLPVLVGAEAALHDTPEQEAMTTRDIDAPPEVVWRHVVSFAELAPPTEWFFKTGIAYPLRARIDGSGVGAVRHCEFSTGPFVEPITTWDPPRRLSFDVTSQPKPMQEWSPYAFINAPHLDSALRSKRGEFRLIPLDGGKRTRLEGSTWYVLEMGPRAYWRVWTELLLHAIHTRVLSHIEALAEADRAP